MEEISFDKFKKIKPLVGKIKEASKISGKDKLPKLNDGLKGKKSLLLKI